LASLLCAFLLTGVSALGATQTCAADETAKPATKPAAKPEAQKPEAQKRDPLEIKPSAAVSALLADQLLSQETRRTLLLQAGRFDDLRNPTPSETAQIALIKGNWNDPVFNQSDLPRSLASQAALSRGEPAKVLQLIEKNAAKNPEEAWLRASALLQTGQRQEARDQIKSALASHDFSSPEASYFKGLLITLSTELNPASPGDFQAALDAFSKAREARLGTFWQAHMAEARLLVDKDQIEAGVKALTEALAIQPALPEGWALFAEIHGLMFDFETADRCIAKASQAHPNHPELLATQAQVAFISRDLETGNKPLHELLARYPTHRAGMALKAASLALAYKEDALKSQMERYAQAFPGDPAGAFVLGDTLSRSRQYADAKAWLKESIRLAPEWSAPWTRLGTLLMQSGEEEEARDTLRHAIKLDAFQRSAVNQLRLVEELLSYNTIRSEHFLIRYKAGVDEAWARDMPDRLEAIYRDVTQTFGFTPKNPTLIELMPDSRTFAVRITGMPFIWTIGASTGDVIALTPPKSGPYQKGLYDWPRVLRHEFTHTVTLGMTQNRIPHWFTEACAVNQEPGEWPFEFYVLLSRAVEKDELFDLTQINWAFARPKKPTDRNLAYAQAAWMMEYITRTYGFPAILKLLDGYREGKSDVENFQAVTGRNQSEFLADFKAWTQSQVKVWGLHRLTPEPRITSILKSPSPNLEQIDKLLLEFPGDRRLLHKRAEILLKGPDKDAARYALYAYGQAVPVDPWPYEELVKLGPNDKNPRESMGALEFLDAQAVTAGGRWSYELSRAYRNGSLLNQAILAGSRAIEREPYNASYREFLATLYLLDKNLDAAAHQIQSLRILEPADPKHTQRLIAIYKKLGRDQDAAKLENPAPPAP
jgi:cellulose synthase operon protein C